MEKKMTGSTRYTHEDVRALIEEYLAQGGTISLHPLGATKVRMRSRRQRLVKPKQHPWRRTKVVRISQRNANLGNRAVA